MTWQRTGAWNLPALKLSTCSGMFTLLYLDPAERGIRALSTINNFVQSLRAMFCGKVLTLSLILLEELCCLP